MSMDDYNMLLCFDLSGARRVPFYRTNAFRADPVGHVLVRGDFAMANQFWKTHDV